MINFCIKGNELSGSIKEVNYLTSWLITKYYGQILVKLFWELALLKFMISSIMDEMLELNKICSFEAYLFIRT
jgi:hypothetical protein